MKEQNEIGIASYIGDSRRTKFEKPASIRCGSGEVVYTSVSVDGVALNMAGKGVYECNQYIYIIDPPVEGSVVCLLYTSDAADE
mgnify:CR=1 FL=1